MKILNLALFGLLIMNIAHASDGMECTEGTTEALSCSADRQSGDYKMDLYKVVVCKGDYVNRYYMLVNKISDTTPVSYGEMELEHRSGSFLKFSRPGFSVTKFALNSVRNGSFSVNQGSGVKGAITLRCK